MARSQGQKLIAFGALMIFLSAASALARNTTGTRVSALQAQQAVALAAERLLMLPGDRPDGSPPPPSLDTTPRDRVASWSSTVGGVGLAPEAVLKRLFGPGHAWVERGKGGRLNVRWRSQKRDRLIGHVRLGEVASDASHFEPTRRALARRNALVGQALLAEIARLQAAGEVSASALPQPSTWKGAPPVVYLSKRSNIQHTLAARLGEVDPLAAALAPVPQTRFMLPADTAHGSTRGRKLRLEWSRWADLVERWIDPRLRPVEGDNDGASRGRAAHADLRAAQRQGWVRPLSLSWRDKHGVHHLELREHQGKKKAIHRIAPRRRSPTRRR